MKGVFTVWTGTGAPDRNSYFRDVCLVYILSVNQEHRLLYQLADGDSKIPRGWMQQVFSLCLTSSPHPSPIVFSFDAVGERPAQSISKSAEQTIKSRNIATPQNTIRTFWRFPVSKGISNSTLCKPHEVSNLVPRLLQRGEETCSLTCVYYPKTNKCKPFFNMKLICFSLCT